MADDDYVELEHGPFRLYVGRGMVGGIIWSLRLHQLMLKGEFGWPSKPRYANEYRKMGFGMNMIPLSYDSIVMGGYLGYLSGRLFVTVPWMRKEWERKCAENRARTAALGAEGESSDDQLRPPSSDA